MSILGGYHEYTRVYHDKCGSRSLGKQLNCMDTPVYLTPPSVLSDIPQCTAQTLCKVIILMFNFLACQVSWMVFLRLNY